MQNVVLLSVVAPFSSNLTINFRITVTDMQTKGIYHVSRFLLEKNGSRFTQAQGGALSTPSPMNSAAMCSARSVSYQIFYMAKNLERNKRSSFIEALVQASRRVHYYESEAFKQWKRISCKQIARWQHLAQLKASAFFSLQKNSC